MSGFHLRVQNVKKSEFSRNVKLKLATLLSIGAWTAIYIFFLLFIIIIIIFCSLFVIIIFYSLFVIIMFYLLFIIIIFCLLFVIIILTTLPPIGAWTAISIFMAESTATTCAQNCELFLEQKNRIKVEKNLRELNTKYKCRKTGKRPSWLNCALRGDKAV